MTMFPKQSISVSYPTITCIFKNPAPFHPVPELCSWFMPKTMFSDFQITSKQNIFSFNFSKGSSGLLFIFSPAFLCLVLKKPYPDTICVHF